VRAATRPLGYCEQTARNWALASPAPGVCFNARDLLAGRETPDAWWPETDKAGTLDAGCDAWLFPDKTKDY
jgi:hypothetical protein